MLPERGRTGNTGDTPLLKLAFGSLMVVMAWSSKSRAKVVRTTLHRPRAVTWGRMGTALSATAAEMVRRATKP